MPEYTEIECVSPEAAHALHAYLLVELGQDEGAPDIAAKVEGSSLQVTHNYNNPRVRGEWDSQLIGYRDGRASLEGTLREFRESIDSALGIRS